MEKIELKNISGKEKGYLFGLFEGDGYKIYQKKSRHYNVEFYLNSEKDKKIIIFLKELLEKIELNPSLYQDKRYNCKRIRVYSKDLFNFIVKNINLEKYNYNFKIGYISGLIDSEGYVNPKKYTIEVINTNKYILEKSKEFLDSIGINSSLAKRKPCIKDRVVSYRWYISVNFKRLGHISIKAGKLDAWPS